MKNKVLVVICILLSLFAAGQQQERESQATVIIEERIEYLLQSLEETEVDLTTLFDDLYYLYENPLNLNSVSREELQSMYLLTDYEISAILHYRKKYDGISSIYELQLIDGMTPQKIRLILPFITTKVVDRPPHIRLRNVAKYGRHEVIMRHRRVFPLAEGYKPVADSVLEENPNARYLGSPDHLYLRYRFRYSKRISAGFTAEKDPGEEFFQGSQPEGFDFYSAHLFLREFGPVKQMAIGDFHFQVGQGLTFWSGFGFRKSPTQTIDVKRFPQVIRPYTASDENNFLRGGAATIELGAFEVTPFYSLKRIDGNLVFQGDTTDFEQEVSFSSIQLTGYHRTPSELQDKDAIREEIFGGNIDYRFNSGRIGVTAVRSSFEPELRKNTQLYQSFEFQGKENTNIGLNYDLNLNRLNLYGEFARSENGGHAMLNGAILSMDDRFRVSALHRYYEREYQSLYANAFGEKGGVRNESGIYIGTEFYPVERVVMNFYADFYEFPWLSYRADAPANGNEYSAQMIINPNRKSNIQLLYRHETKAQNAPIEEGANDILSPQIRNRYRLQYGYRINDFIELRTRLEFSHFTHEPEERKSGVLFYQDLYINSKDEKLSLRLRYALFDTDDYDSRIYAYEHDLRYQFTVPAYYQRGSRTYAVVRYKITDGILLNVKWSQTFNSNADTFGSGKDEIQSNQRSELKSQLIFRF